MLNRVEDRAAIRTDCSTGLDILTIRRCYHERATGSNDPEQFVQRGLAVGFAQVLDRFEKKDDVERRTVEVSRYPAQLRDTCRATDGRQLRRCSLDRASREVGAFAHHTLGMQRRNEVAHSTPEVEDASCKRDSCRPDESEQRPAYARAEVALFTLSAPPIPETSDPICRPVDIVRFETIHGDRE